MMRIWAVGLKDWVQLRKSPEKPLLKESSSSRKSNQSKQVPIYNTNSTWTGRYKTETALSTLTIKTSYVEGGEVVAVCKKRSFVDRTKISIKENEIKEVPPELAEPIILDDWKNKVRRE